MSESREARSGRFLSIGLTGVSFSILAVILGYNQGAAGIFMAIPIALFNHYLMIQTVNRLSDADRRALQSQILSKSMLRLGISAAAVLLSFFAAGAEFMVGVLIGLVLETFTYFGDLFGLLLKKKG